MLTSQQGLSISREFCLQNTTTATGYITEPAQFRFQTPWWCWARKEGVA